MYKTLMSQGFGISEIDEWDIEWFFSILELDDSETASAPKVVPIDAVF